MSELSAVIRLQDVSKRCADAEAKLRELGVEARGGK